jgi:hypothetical protein
MRELVMFKKLFYIAWCSSALLLALSCEAATSSQALDLAAQLATMDKAAETSLDIQIYTVDGLDVTAWQDGLPVIIKVPILDEKREWQGDSRYYFKRGKLFAVQMLYGRYQFDGRGNMILWQDETGVQNELPGTATWSTRQEWLQKRALQLFTAFAPSAYEVRLKKPGSDIHLQGAAKVEYLCIGQLYALTRAEKLLHTTGALKAEGRSLSGPLQARFVTGWRPLSFSCAVDGADRVSHLTYQYTAPLQPVP